MEIFFKEFIDCINKKINNINYLDLIKKFSYVLDE